MQGLNAHTGDRSKPVGTDVSVLIGTETYRFVVWSSRESAAVLKAEDWTLAQDKLQRHIAEKRYAMFCSGDLFLSSAGKVLRDDAERTMKRLIYERLRARQQKAGCELWQVDSHLAGEKYAV